MKEQSNLFQNQVRVDPLKYHVPQKIVIKVGESKEYLTRSGNIIQVQKKKDYIYGEYYQITDQGKVTGPYQSIGIKNYIQRN